MDFDEYEYLEKTVENPELLKLKEGENGSVEIKSDDKDRRRSSKHKSNGEDDGHRLNRTKSGDDSHDLDKERGSSRRRSSPRDGDRSERDRHRSSHEHRGRDRDRDRDRDERNGRDRDRDKDRGADRERDHARGRRERDPEHDKDRETGRDRGQSRRSRSRSERHRDERDGENIREGEYKEKERQKEKEIKEPERENRRYKEKKEEPTKPEVDPERDQRTVFAYQLSLKADERDVYEFFSRAGKVRDVRLIMDRNSRRSRGVGYVEFYDSMSVPMAIALSGQLLLGAPVMVKPSEAEKNLVQSTAAAGGGANGVIGPYSGGARRLYVGNLHYNFKEDQLRQVFEPFGSVELVQVPTDPETGLCKGYGFIQFARLEDARAAESLNGQLEIAGRAIKVSAMTDQAGMQDAGINPGDFDDDEGGGLSLNARSRALLMQNLDRSGTTTSFFAGSLSTGMVNGLGLAMPAADISVPAITVPSVESIGIPSECLLLKNMFDPTIEDDLNFDLDIKDDVKEECSKHGTLEHIYVEKNSEGFVYLRFQSTQSAMAAQRALHGRWFAGKMITATFMLPQIYEGKFPDSK